MCVYVCVTLHVYVEEGEGSSYLSSMVPLLSLSNSSSNMSNCFYKIII